MNKSVVVVGVVLAIAILALVVSKPREGITSVVSGEPVLLNINAQDVQDLAGVQTDVIYNAAVVRFDSISEGTFLDAGVSSDAMLLDTTDASQRGVISGIVVLRLKPTGVSGSGTVASVHFTRIAEGEPGIQLENVLLSNSDVQPLPTNSITGAVTAG